MTINTTNPETRPAIHSGRPARQLRVAGVAGGALAALLAWSVERYAAGLHLRTPTFSASTHPTHLSAGFIFFVALAAGAAGWGSLALLERRTERPRRFWLTVGGLVGVVSLTGPLSGHGVSATDGLGLVCLHLAVAAVVLPVLAASTTNHRGDGFK